MQNITEKQIKQIAKQISQEYKNVQYSKVIEVISHSLGYKDYNALSAKFKKECNKEIERPIKDLIDIKLDNIAHSLGFSDYTAFKDYNASYYAEQKAHTHKEIKKTVLYGKICPNCDGKKGWEVGVVASVDDFMWIDEGEYMDIGYKECFWCSGIGRATNKRIKEMKRLKRENKDFSC